MFHTSIAIYTRRKIQKNKLTIQQNQERRTIHQAWSNQEANRKRKDNSLLEKANGIKQTNKQTNPLPKSLPSPSLPLITPTPTPTHPQPPALSQEKGVKTKADPNPQGNGFRKTTDGRRLSDRCSGGCVQARPFDNVRSAWSIGPKKLCKHQSALASEPARVTLIAEFGHGSRDGARSNQAEGCQSTVASGYQKSVNFRAGDTRGVVKGMIKI
jgi:hypothetical protein